MGTIKNQIGNYLLFNLNYEKWYINFSNFICPSATPMHLL